MNRCVGIVDSVSSYEIKGYLLDSAPRNVALASGISLFPRINGFLLIPNETGSLVGIITWIGYSQQNFGNEVALPRGTRCISLSILGHIENTINGQKFERGAFSLPTVGDQIFIPSEEELSVIIKNDSKETIAIGTAPLNGNQEVKIPVNELFGRHIAVLGNTGSGKSCTVAGLIRWSIEQTIKSNGKSPNARFIVLDPNGEYGSAFDDLDIDVMKYKVQPMNDEEKQLRTPAWMWTSNEWASVFRASDKTQKPVLREALRTLRSASDVTDDANNDIINVQRRLLFLREFLKVSISLQKYIGNDKTSFGKDMKERIESLKYSVKKLDNDVVWKNEVIELCDKGYKIQENHSAYKKAKYIDKDGNLVEYYDPFNSQEIEEYQGKVIETINEINVDENISSISEDDPIEFPLKELANIVEDIAGKTSASQYVDFMTIRIKSMLKNAVLAPVIGNNQDATLLEWINGYLGTGKDDKSIRGKICVIDLSLLPSEMVHLIVATISRLIFESLQRYRRFYDIELPTVLVMEEAHNFIHRYKDEDYGPGKLCSQVFEKIAREGRKFGLGLIVSSQRPAELSQTVLSQCNSFIIHRIVNDRDQEMVRKMVPDNLGDILSELPSLPTRKAVILGSAIPVPTIVDINELKNDHKPRSDTPDFWSVWTGTKICPVEWQPIVREWQKK